MPGGVSTIAGGSSKQAADVHDRCIGTIDYAGLATIQNRSFACSEVQNDVTAGESKEYLIVIPAGLRVHADLDISVEAVCHYKMYRNPDVVKLANKVPVVDLNDFSSKKSQIKVYEDSPVSHRGTYLSGVVVGGLLSGGTAGRRWYLGHPTKKQQYYIRITNKSANTQDISIDFRFIEDNLGD